jgi:hypothetical protein
MAGLTNELERMVKEWIVAYLRHCPGIFLEGLKKSMEHLGYSVSGPRSEPGTSRRESRSATHTFTL